MIDASEPKDGDFVRYVETMVRLPAGVKLPDQGEGPGSTSRIGRRERAMQKLRAAATEAPRAADLARSASRDGQWGRGGEGAPASARRPGARAAGSSTDIEQAAHQAVRVLLTAVRRIGTVMLVAGAALLALSFADESPFGPDPMPGFALMFAGALMRGLATRALR